jgi:beta-glucosidase
VIQKPHQELHASLPLTHPCDGFTPDTMAFLRLKLLSLVLLSTRTLSDVTTGIPDAAPPGFEEWESPIVLPAPPVAGKADWASAVQRARAFVEGLTLPEKVNVTTGVDIMGRCVGNTGVSLDQLLWPQGAAKPLGSHTDISAVQTIPRIGWQGLCLEDSPLGVRLADFVSAFPAGINAAATWDVDLIKYVCLPQTNGRSDL